MSGKTRYRQGVSGEVQVESAFCQRWRNGRHTFRSDPHFDPDAYTVEPVTEAAAKAFVMEHHYSVTYPSVSKRYGLFLDDWLVGVMILGIPVQEKVLTGPLPDLEPYVESLELSRFVLLDECPANSESWFLARGFEAAAAQGVRGVVSFADPVPRRVAGDVVFPGHIGIIYQATNARYTGRSTARTLAVVPNGAVLNAYTQQKIRQQKKGHEYAERLLVSHGARPLRAGENPARWLADALDAAGATRLRHGGCHRYVFAIGETRTQRRRVRIAGADFPYPKETDAA